MHAATASAGAASTAPNEAVWLNGLSNAFKSLGGTYGSEPLFDWTYAKCSCIAKVARSASHKIRYARSQPGGEPSREKCAGHCPGTSSCWRRFMRKLAEPFTKYPTIRYQG
eukprot:6192561-Pleurochrysis_carterae.AAC.2